MNKIKTPKRDIQAEVTARILSDLESGTPTWVKPWAAGTSEPVNHSTGNAYSGINTLILWLSGYQSSRWATYKQAQSMGGQVRKGERGTQIVVCKSVVKKSDSPDKDPISTLKCSVISAVFQLRTNRRFRGPRSSE